MLIRSVLTLLLATTAISCGKGGIGNPFGSSDPFEGQPDTIRNAEPPAKEGEKPTPPADLRDEEITLEVVSPNSDAEGHNVMEGISLDIFLGGKVARPEFKSKVDLENMPDFPGSTFNNPTPGVFSWTPPLGTVTDPAQPVLRRLRVGVSALNSSGAVVKTRKFFVNIKIHSSTPRLFEEEVQVENE